MVTNNCFDNLFVYFINKDFIIYYNIIMLLFEINFLRLLLCKTKFLAWIVMGSIIKLQVDNLYFVGWLFLNTLLERDICEISEKIHIKLFSRMRREFFKNMIYIIYVKKYCTILPYENRVLTWWVWFCKSFDLVSCPAITEGGTGG